MAKSFGVIASTDLYGRRHAAWRGQGETGAEGGADRRFAKDAASPLDQSREAHHPARPLHSPDGAMRQGRLAST
jgi:hypothetical protein